MARKALIRKSDGLVVNVILADESYVPPDGVDVVSAESAGSPGDRWDGVKFIPPAPTPPNPDIAAFKNGTTAEKFLILGRRIGVV